MEENRIIKFRGKSSDNGEWVYGYYQHSLWREGTEESNKHFIHLNQGDAERLGQCEVCIMPKTVGQYTGIRDKNEVEIYEGDIIGNEYIQGEIKWLPEHCAFVARVCDATNHAYIFLGSDGHIKNVEIVGNIHDNKRSVIK